MKWIQNNSVLCCFSPYRAVQKKPRSRAKSCTFQCVLRCAIPLYVAWWHQVKVKCAVKNLSCDIFQIMVKCLISPMFRVYSQTSDKGACCLNFLGSFITSSLQMFVNNPVASPRSLLYRDASQSHSKTWNWWEKPEKARKFEPKQPKMGWK